jgi:hypothetical protein
VGSRVGVCQSEMDIAYLAQTEWSTLLLDGEGVCVQVRARHGKKAAGDGAARCIGAQYVASLDRSAAGGLIEMPRIGCPMVFAATTADGRIYLVRTGPVMHFEEVSSGVHDAGALPLQERGHERGHDRGHERGRSHDRARSHERAPREISATDHDTTPFRKAAAAKRSASSYAHGGHQVANDLPAPNPPPPRPSPPPPRQSSRRASPASPSATRETDDDSETYEPEKRTQRYERVVPPAPASSAPTRRTPLASRSDDELLASREVMYSLSDDDLKSERGGAAYAQNPAPPRPGPAPWQPTARTSRRR